MKQSSMLFRTSAINIAPNKRWPTVYFVHLRLRLLLPETQLINHGLLHLQIPSSAQKIPHLVFLTHNKCSCIWSKRAIHLKYIRLAWMLCLSRRCPQSHNRRHSQRSSSQKVNLFLQPKIRPLIKHKSSRFHRKVLSRLTYWTGKLTGVL